MDNKKTITICAIIALVVLAIVLIITLVTELYSFFIVLLALFIVLIVSLAIYLREKPDDYSLYIKEKKRILKTYGSVIIEVETLPNIVGKNIIKVKSMDDLVDAQLELREPIYFKNDNDSCFFLLLHYNEACIYILKLNDNVISPTEQSIRFMKKDDDKNPYESLLDNIEDTIVFKLDEMRSYKISPIRNKKKIEVVDDTAIKKKIKDSKDFKEETLIDELSKTTILKNLKEQIEELEKEHINEKKSSVKEVVVKKIEEEKKVDIKEPKKKERVVIDMASNTVKKISVEEPKKTIKEILKKKENNEKNDSHSSRRIARFKKK